MQIPAVDGNYGEGEASQFLLGEVRAHRVINRIGNVAVRKEGQDFRPCQRGLLTGGIPGALPPCAK